MQRLSIRVARPPKPGWFATRGMLLLAYVSVFAVVLLLSSLDDGGFTQGSIAGLPLQLAMVLIAAPLAVIGTIWMRRILRAGSEPEANDRHWWSRA